MPRRGAVARCSASCSKAPASPGDRFDDYPYPVLPNCDDSPSKEAYLARGWARRQVRRESLHALFFNPGEGRNVIDEPDYADVRTDLRARLHQWMVDTSDPWLGGPIDRPPGARVNAQDQLSAGEPCLPASQPAPEPA